MALVISDSVIRRLQTFTIIEVNYSLKYQSKRIVSLNLYKQVHKLTWRIFMKNAIALIIISFIVTGCATLDGNKDKKESIYTKYINDKNLEPQKKITSFHFSGWRSLDNEHLILSTSFNKPYLIDLAGYCNDLRFTQSIVVHNSGSTLHAKFDSISVLGGHMNAGHSIRCRIDSIYRITKKQANELSGLKSKKKTEES